MLSALLLAAIVSAAPPSTAATALSVIVEGAPPVVLTEQTLRALPHEPVAWTDKAGEHHGEGTSLEAVLAHAGFVPLSSTTPAPPAARKHPALRSVIVVAARDGYATVFSAAELTSSLGATRAFVVWAENNTAVDDAAGPLRLVVTTDKMATRAVRQLSTITVQRVGP